jgi:hypothetical protein
MKVGDVVTAILDNKTPGGLEITGEITSTDSAAGLLQVQSQFGVRIWVSEAAAKPVDA